MTTSRAFALVVLAQVIALLGWAGWHEHVRQTAPVIRLKTVPVDPRDLLRGDFMILRYEISNVAPPAAAANDAARGSKFWVTLAPREGYYEALGASWSEPVVAPGQFAVRAWKGPRGVAYGIENYFVPEGKGTPRFRTLEVEALVGAGHRLYLKRVLVDGQPYP